MGMVVDAEMLTSFGQPGSLIILLLSPARAACVAAQPQCSQGVSTASSDGIFPWHQKLHGLSVDQWKRNPRACQTGCWLFNVEVRMLRSRRASLQFPSQVIARGHRHWRAFGTVSPRRAQYEIWSAFCQGSHDPSCAGPLPPQLFAKRQLNWGQHEMDKSTSLGVIVVWTLYQTDPSGLLMILASRIRERDLVRKLVSLRGWSRWWRNPAGGSTISEETITEMRGADLFFSN